MTQSVTPAGIGLSWGIEHKTSDGRLISRQANVVAPDVPHCIRLGCLLKYLHDALLYALVASWHSRRVYYAEKNRNKRILEKYRTGEPSPNNLLKAIYANIKLTCPVCRKINTGGW